MNLTPSHRPSDMMLCVTAGVHNENLSSQPEMRGDWHLRVENMTHEAFICHASEDKEDFVRPLAQALGAKGVNVWYDEFSLNVGDSLRQAIDDALGKSKFGIVVLSPSFFAKRWPARELDGLVQRQMNGECVILPIWHRVNEPEVREYSAPLANIVAVPSSSGIDAVVDKLLAVMRSGAVETRTSATEKLPVKDALSEKLLVKDLLSVASQLHQDRLALIAANQMPIKMGNGAKVVAHIVPIDTLLRDHRLTGDQIRHAWQVWPLDSGVDRHFMSPLGRVQVGQIETKVEEQTYALIFANGSLEGVDLGILDPKRGGGRRIDNYYLEEKLVEFIFHA